jgi:hypothetical protein
MNDEPSGAFPDLERRSIAMKNVLLVTWLLAAIAVVVPAVMADEPAALPDGFKGFRGLLKGTISGKTENSFVLKVKAVTKSFEKSKATKPEDIVGKEITLQVKAERLQKALKERAVGDTVEVGAVNEEGNVVVAVEQLKKVEAADAAAALPDGFKGFRGLLKGTLSSKTENSFVLKVASVLKTFPKNKATKAEDVVGKEITLQVKAERLQKILKELAAGNTVEVGAMNETGNVVVAVEELKKVEADK